MARSLRFGNFEVDLAAGELYKRGVRLPLREKSFLVLATLLEHAGEMVTRDRLQQRLWPADVFVDVENNLNTAVARLRETLGDTADHPRFIETLPKRGYRFIAPVSNAATHSFSPDVGCRALFERGRRHLFKGTSHDFDIAKQCFEQAAERDPQFALAYDALAQLHWYLGFLGFAPPRDVSSAGMFYALRALEIDNTLAETHALIGLFRSELDLDKSEMKRALQRALDLDRSSPVVKLRYAVAWLMPTGRLEEAIAEIESATESDPLSIELRAWLGVMFWLARQYDRAIEQAQLTIEIQPPSFIGHFLLGIFCREKRVYEESIAAHRKAVELTGESMLTLGWLGLALGQGGRTAEARTLLDRFHEAAARMYVPPTSFAWTCLGLGDIDDAFRWMDRAADGCDHMLTPVLSYPFLDPLRHDPRYAALLQKLMARRREFPAARASSVS